ncbi:FtsX-like permease family protein [Cellulomonas sp. 179-A 9B4 NHS]|uniref:FtsX-like permease family protein n=1 Tax=Cellulomonas sp. 179-A 9B4 NHS TaxID=3142379 RepID=UPI00399FA93E
MSALVALGARLVVVGGRLRAGVVVVGTAVATVLLLATAAVPGALHAPGAPVDPVQRANTTAVLTFSLVPAVVLVMTAARTSGAARDRRSAALRLLGLTRARTVAVAAVENGLLGLVGALCGLGVFLLAAPAVDAVVAAGPGWFAAPFTVGPGTALLGVASTALASVGVAAASTVRTTRRPVADRSEATPRRSSPWRLLPAAVAVVALGLVTDRAGSAPWVRSDAGAVVLLVGAVAGAIAIAAVTPLLSTWCAALLVRSRSVTGVLAGRGLQADPAGSGRLVAGVGVAVYLVLAALAVLTSFESTPQYRYALQTIRQGPQPVLVRPAGEVQQRDVTALSAVPGVRAVVPRYDVAADGWCAPGAPCPVEVFVGTCADLGQLMAVSGCRDDRAAALTVAGYEGTENGMPADVPALATADAVDVRFGDDGPLVTVPLGDVAVQDSAATQERWVYPSSYDLFVPRSVADAAGATPTSLTVVADGGLDVRAAVADAAPPDATVLPYPMDDYEAALRVRAVVATLSAAVVAVGLLALGMVAVDRAVERRRAVARYVAVGIPGRALRAAQLAQTLVPLLVAVALAAGLGGLMVRAYAAAAGWPALRDGTQLGLVTAATLAGAVLVSLATLPAVRTRVTADLLRRE